MHECIKKLRGNVDTSEEETENSCKLFTIWQENLTRRKFTHGHAFQLDEGARKEEQCYSAYVVHAQGVFSRRILLCSY